VVLVPRPVDDPSVRQPDTTRAVERLGWHPAVPVEEGLRRTIDWFRTHPELV
jgi:dTDP-glucose 4,6-dehydratase